MRRVRLGRGLTIKPVGVHSIDGSVDKGAPVCGGAHCLREPIATAPTTYDPRKRTNSELYGQRTYREHDLGALAATPSAADQSL